MSRRNFLVAVILWFLCVGLISCQQDVFSDFVSETIQGTTPTPESTATVPEPTATEEVTHEKVAAEPTEVPTATPAPTNTPAPTEAPTLAPEASWKADINVGPVKKVEDMKPLPYEKIDEILPVIRQREAEYLKGKDISQNELDMSAIELLPGYPFSTFDIQLMDSVGKRDKLEIASMNMFVDKTGREYFLFGLPHNNRQRGNGSINFTGHYIVDLDAMKKHFVSEGKPELLNTRFNLQVVLDAIANNQDRVLEARVYVVGAPGNEKLVEGQSWQFIAPLIQSNEAKTNFTSKIIELRNTSDKIGAPFDETFIKQYEDLIIPVAWFSFVK